MKFRTHSLRAHLLATLAAAITLTTLIQAGFAYRVALDEVGQISDFHMERFAHAAYRRIMAGAEEGTYIEMPGSGDRGFWLMVSSLKAPLPPQLPTAETGFSSRLSDGHTYRVFTLCTTTQKIEVVQDMAARSLEASRVAFRTTLPVLVIAPFLMLTLWWVISRALRPIRTSRREIANRFPDDLRPLSTRQVPEELLPFVNEINSLFVRISHAFAAQQSFIGNAAHELRSPLAALRLQVQSLQRAQTPEARQKATERLLAGIDRATRLIAQMLELARADAPASSFERTDLPSLIRLALSDALPSAQTRQIEVSANLPEDAPPDCFGFTGNVEALRTMLRNLLENAIKYAPQNGAVLINLSRTPTELVLEIEDNGPGIPGEERAEIFDRFKRGAAPKAEGCGLGLAIVKTIADRHRINITLADSPRLGGLATILHFPMKSENLAA